MSPTTDERLKSGLDTNQQAQERMCLAVLSADKRYSDIRPRHPQGGPDRGRDIDAKFKAEYVVFGAVGFVNSVNDSAPHKTKAKKKFKADLSRAGSAFPKPKVFAFFTNVRLTLSERDELRKLATTAGMIECDIYDRERIRVALDAPDGLAARFQYLQIPMSEAEQASFFARWGDDIQSVISTGFGRLETKLSQILFSQEAGDPLDHFHIRVQLDKSYSAAEIGHFRLFATFYRGEFADGISAFLFGSSDRSGRMRDGLKGKMLEENPGIGAGISSGQWIQTRTLKEGEGDHGEKDVKLQADEAEEKWQRWSGGSSIGIDPVSTLSIGYSQGGLFRIPPYIRLKDLDDGMFILYANLSLAEKVSSIQIFGNSYKLKDIDKANMSFETIDRPSDIPANFTEEELNDPWVVIRPDLYSTFQLNFSEELPIRFYEARQVLPVRDRLSD